MAIATKKRKRIPFTTEEVSLFCKILEKNFMNLHSAFEKMSTEAQQKLSVTRQPRNYADYYYRNLKSKHPLFVAFGLDGIHYNTKIQRKKEPESTVKLHNKYGVEKSLAILEIQKRLESAKGSQRHK